MRRIEQAVQWDDESGTQVALYVTREDGSHDMLGITITTRKSWGAQAVGPATVNWAACGSVLPGKADLYARALAVAVNVALDLDAKVVAK